MILVPRNPDLGPLYIWNDHVPVSHGWPAYQYHEREQVRTWNWSERGWQNRAVPVEDRPPTGDLTKAYNLPPGTIHIAGPMQMMVTRLSTYMLDQARGVQPMSVLLETRKAFLAAPPGHVLVAWDAYPWLLGLVWSNEPFVGHTIGWPKHEVKMEGDALRVGFNALPDAIRADLEADLLPLEGIPWWDRLATSSESDH